MEEEKCVAFKLNRCMKEWDKTLRIVKIRSLLNQIEHEVDEAVLLELWRSIGFIAYEVLVDKDDSHP